MDYMNDLHELCEIISREIADANEKIRNAGGKLTSGDADYIDKLTHTLKSIKTTMAMMEDEDGYSNRSYPDGMGGSYRGYARDGRGYSNARGRMNAQRDSRGRYSGADGDVEDIKRDMQRLMDKVEKM